MVLELRLGDLVRLKKGHPCGSDEWEVTRLGADIGLKCQGCGRYLMMPRSDLEKRFKQALGKRPEGGSQDRLP